MQIQVTKGEHNLIKRRRKGLTQVQLAAQQGRFQVNVMQEEQDETPHGVIKINDHEYCFLMRRRSGLSHRKAAAAMGFSHQTLAVKERKADPEIVEFWQNYFKG